MATQVPPLQEILAEVPDHRHPQGKRYPLVAMLNVVGIGLLCGYRNITAIAEWLPHPEGYSANLVDAGGDCVLSVKDKQSATKEAIAEWFAEEPLPFLLKNDDALTKGR